MRFIFILQFVFAVTPLLSQDVLWEKSYGGTLSDYLSDAQPTADFGFILAGSSLSDKSGNKQEKNLGNLDYWVWKMDEFGELDWQKSYGGSGKDMLTTLVQTRDGGFLLAGSSDSPKGVLKRDDGFGLEDFWVIKLNADGSEQWQKTIGGIGNDRLVSAIETKDGAYLLAGTSNSPESNEKRGSWYGNQDYWIVKLDAAGEYVWDNTFGGTYFDGVEAIVQGNDETYFVLGYSTSGETGNKKDDSFGVGDYWLIHLDTHGDMIWQRSLGGEKDDHPYSLLNTNDDTLIVGGISSSSNSGSKQTGNAKGTDYWILMVDYEGRILWEQTYDIGEYDMLGTIIQNNDGTLVLGGTAKSEKVGLKASDSKGINDYTIIKIDDKGDELWREEVGSNGDDFLKTLIETRDGGYLLAGTSNGATSGERNTALGQNDFWIVKLGDKDKDKDGPSGLLEAFPNPTPGYSNVIVNFEFENGTATLYDIGGRQLDRFAISSRTVPVNLHRLPVGIYLVTIDTDTETESIKIIKRD